MADSIPRKAQSVSAAEAAIAAAALPPLVLTGVKLPMSSTNSPTRATSSSGISLRIVVISEMNPASPTPRMLTKVSSHRAPSAAISP